MRASERAFTLIKGFEGYSAIPYTCPGKRLTIGYGTTRGVYKGQHVSPQQAEELLKMDVAEFEEAINKLVKVPLTQNQYDALLSFTYNVGAAALEDSTLLIELNKMHYEAVPVQMKRWTRAQGVQLKGLVTRREKEAALFEEL